MDAGGDGEKGKGSRGGRGKGERGKGGGGYDRGRGGDGQRDGKGEGDRGKGGWYDRGKGDGQRDRYGTGKGGKGKADRGKGKGKGKGGASIDGKPSERVVVERLKLGTTEKDVRELLEGFLGEKCGITGIEVRETKLVVTKGRGRDDEFKQLQPCAFAKVKFETTEQASQAAQLDAQLKLSEHKEQISLLNDTFLSRKLSETLRHNALVMGLDIRKDAYVNVGQLQKADGRIDHYTLEEIEQCVLDNKKQRFSLYQELSKGCKVVAKTAIEELDIKEGDCGEVAEVTPQPNPEGHDICLKLEGRTVTVTKSNLLLLRSTNGASSVDKHWIRANQGHSESWQKVLDEDWLLEPITHLRQLHDKSLCCVHGTMLHDVNSKPVWEKIQKEGLSPMDREHVHFASREPWDKTVVSGMKADREVLIYLDTERWLQSGFKLGLSQNDVLLTRGVVEVGGKLRNAESSQKGVVPPAFFKNVKLWSGEKRRYVDDSRWPQGGTPAAAQTAAAAPVLGLPAPARAPAPAPAPAAAPAKAEACVPEPAPVAVPVPAENAPIAIYRCVAPGGKAVDYRTQPNGERVPLNESFGNIIPVLECKGDWLRTAKGFLPAKVASTILFEEVHIQEDVKEVLALLDSKGHGPLVQSAILREALGQRQEQPIHDGSES